ncbi:tetratricopeptide repeat protein 39C-like isoform X1 [Haliotis rufescens]|uniref:tetratricopeptide repeat protein 39C-like isoform X1 n=2 Tax=Haliotis rufescens TaxID=6454 RepID=UPI001EAFEF3A|nr:tetratricopeptide repeat protein 39C-like isoform X1 [Haliotis rufescens]
MAQANEIEDMNVGEGEDPGLTDDAEMALTGINMLLNNGFDEAYALFEKYKNESPLMHAGYSFVFFMQALMSFEEEKLGEALKVLQHTEKKCEISDGFLRSVKKRFSKKKRQQSEAEVSVEDRIQRQVIVADSLLYQAILVFTNQDIASYVKGGWYLRKAWKLYEKVHKEILDLSEKQARAKIEKMTNSLPSNTNQNSVYVHDSATDGNDNELTEEVLSRLCGAVNFGYGTFQLCISMVPPKILKLIEFLGFEGDREAGLGSLEYTSHSKDMKAPLATLGLLWYHTVLRPFFALDGANSFCAGTAEAENIIAEKENDFPNSALFLFFRGRIHRLRKENDLSLGMYQKALEEAAGQREIELMCLYEISWCNLLKLRWSDTLEGFTRLRAESKWSKAYYSYLMSVCLGAQGDVDKAYEILKEVPGLVKKKNNQIEAFVGRRAEKFKKVPPTQEQCRLLTLELVFLWHALPTCTHEELKPMLDVCDMQTDHKIYHLKCLVEGSIYKELGEEEMAVQCLKEALARHQGIKDDYHVPAFTLFELASIYMKTPEMVGEAKACLQKIKDNFKDYDFENRLTVRVNNALKELKRRSQEAGVDKKGKS